MNNAWLRWIMLGFLLVDFLINPLSDKLITLHPVMADVVGLVSGISLAWIPLAIFIAVCSLFEYEKPIYSVFYMGLAAIIAEIPYDYMISSKFVDWSHQNPLIGLIILCFLMLLANMFCEKNKIWGYVAIGISTLLGFSIVLLHVDYAIQIVLITTIYTLTHWLELWFESPWVKLIAMVAVMLSLFSWPITFGFIGAILPTFYNGEWGFYNRFTPYIGYWSIIAVTIIFSYLAK